MNAMKYGNMKPETVVSRAKAIVAKRQSVLDYLHSAPHSSAKLIAEKLGFEQSAETVVMFLGEMVRAKEIVRHGRVNARYTAIAKETRPAEKILGAIYKADERVRTALAGESEGEAKDGAAPAYVNGRMVNDRADRKPIKNPDAMRCGLGSLRKTSYLENAL